MVDQAKVTGFFLMMLTGGHSRFSVEPVLEGAVWGVVVSAFAQRHKERVVKSVVIRSFVRIIVSCAGW